MKLWYNTTNYKSYCEQLITLSCSFDFNYKFGKLSYSHSKDTFLYIKKGTIVVNFLAQGSLFLEKNTEIHLILRQGME